MTITKILPGTGIVSSPVNSNFNAAFTLELKNHIRTLIDRTGIYSKDGTDLWGEAYTSAGGRNSGVITANTSASFDTNKYKVRELPYPCVVIEATSVTTSAFNINNCSAERLGAYNYWVVSCSTGTDEVKRAQIYRTLFVGGWSGSTINGNASSLVSVSPPIASSVTGLTNLYTNINRDIGFKAYFSQVVFNPNSPSAVSLKTDFTFANTSDNRISSWVWANRSFSGTSNLQCPISTNIYSGASTNTFGTNTSAQEKINPADLRHTNISSSDNNASGIGCLFLFRGDISFVDDGNPANTGILQRQKIDYFSSGIPLFSDVSSIVIESIISHTIPAGTFPSNISSAVGSFIAQDWEEGASVEYKLTNATEDTGWLNPNITENFTAFTSEPEELIVKLIPKESSPTAGVPAIRGFGAIVQ